MLWGVPDTLCIFAVFAVNPALTIRPPPPPLPRSPGLCVHVCPGTFLDVERRQGPQLAPQVREGLRWLCQGGIKL